MLEEPGFKTHSCWWHTGPVAAVSRRNTIRSRWWRCRRLRAGTGAPPSWSANAGVTARGMSPGTSRLALRECFLPNTFLPCVLTQWMFLQVISAFLIKSYQTQTRNFFIRKSEHFGQFLLTFLPPLAFDWKCPFFMRNFNFSLKSQPFW